MSQRPESRSRPAVDNTSSSPSQGPAFRTRRRVEWADTDAAGIAHFTALFRYMEEAEHALLRELGLSVSCQDEQGHISWPRVAAHAEFLGPARFGDVLDIEAAIRRRGEKSVTYRFTISCEGRPVAQGHVTAVCCRVGSGQNGLHAIAIPSWIGERLARFEIDGNDAPADADNAATSAGPTAPNARRSDDAGASPDAAGPT